MIGPIPGIVISAVSSFSRALVRSLLSSPSIFSSRPSIRSISSLPSSTTASGGAESPSSSNPTSCVIFGPALRSNNSELGQVTPKGIDGLRALTHQQVTGAKEHPLRLLCLGLDRHEAFFRGKKEEEEPIILLPWSRVELTTFRRCAALDRPMNRLNRILRGSPDHLARFSDETAMDTRTTDHQKVPVYATVRDEAPIDWYDDLLTRFPNAPEVKSHQVLANFESLPGDTRKRLWRGLGDATIHISDPRPHLGRLDETCLKRCDMRFETLVRRVQERNGKAASQIRQSLHRLIGQRMLMESLGDRLSRILQIAERRPYLDQVPPEEDPINLINRLQRPRKSIITVISEYTARSSAAFAPAYERATTYGGEADHGRFWFGLDSTDLVLRGTLKPLEDGHAFDCGNARLTNTLENKRRRMVERLTRNSLFARHSLGPRDMPAFLDMDSRVNKRIQAADIAAGFARHVLRREGLPGVIKRWRKVYYNGSRLTEDNLESVLRFWSTVDTKI